jgi:hemoglobin
VTGILGGPWKYQGKNMKELHKDMPITNKHFEIVWGHLESAFLLLRVSGEHLEEIQEVIETLRKDIVQIKD